MISDTPSDLRRKAQDERSIKYELEPGGVYRIDNYDRAPAFASFLPGIGGKDGVPLWCMYVSRGQAVVSFGIHDKDHAVAEFLPVTWAYQLVGLQGFRTFCKVDGEYYEPFKNDVAPAPDGVSRTMRIEAHRLELVENNEDLGLSFKVEYFAPVNQIVGSLVRVVTITNHSGQSRRLKVLDGLALILPAGFTDRGLKSMRRIHEAYASVRLVRDKVPFYSTKVVAHDEAEVSQVEQGSFYAAWMRVNGTLLPVQPLVDPDIVFGNGNDLITPRRFIAEENLKIESQVWENRFPCALVPVRCMLERGASVTLTAMTGYAPNAAVLEEFLSRFTTAQEIQTALTASRREIESVVTPALTVSGIESLNAYARQNYLDNVLRGGVPHILPSADGPTLIHLYSRRHGDLERDYNDFDLPPHPLSSGPGNYRDVCQNRRSDVWFYPCVGDREIRTFVELLQADGYNPLSVEGFQWKLPEDADPVRFCPTEDLSARESFEVILRRSFHPGELIAWTVTHSLEVEDLQAWLYSVLAECGRKLVASGHEGGYWIDHWTYITDLLEAFAGVYPDDVQHMLSGDEDVEWFYDGAYVRPRVEKYVRRKSGPVQTDAVVDGPADGKRLAPVTVFGKLCALLAVKAVSFDYGCRGIEMEAGRPAWNDSLNGLPALFGSSTCEAAELARLAAWLRRRLPSPPDTTFPVEVADFIDEVVEDLQKPNYCWDRAATLRERYRARVRHDINGKTRTVAAAKIESLLAGVEKRARAAVERSVDPKTGLIHTYYTNAPVGVEDGNGRKKSGTDSKSVEIESFRQEPLPLFLEGQVHRLRILNDVDAAGSVYRAVRESPLFDTSLQMYKLNESLGACLPSIGRARTFTRGWFENESIWPHMSYKYLLELLRAGLYDEFFADAATMLVPFMDPKVYGRSITENSSFMGSSANPDPGTHGRGFVARLSGATAEFIQMWLLLTVGQRPFFVDEGGLGFCAKPVLPGAWFTHRDQKVLWKTSRIDVPKNSFACALLGSTLLVYHNEKRNDTFGSSGVVPVRYRLDDQEKIESASLGSELAERVRARAFSRIDVWLE